jgi:hypothetical protein
VTIDALVGGNLGASGQQYVHHPEAPAGFGIIGRISPNGTIATDQIGTLDSVIAVTMAMPNVPGLLLLDGEVIAYRPVLPGEVATNPPAGLCFLKIIGRMLLGKGLGANQALPTHALGLTTPTQTVTRRLSAIPLPLGPVATIAQDIPDQKPFQILTNSDGKQMLSGAFDAPCALVCAPDGSADKAEIIYLPPSYSVTDSNNITTTYHATAPWLRGMYNSTPKAAGKAKDILIGWWPRFASGLPVAATAEHYRCRSYTWAGYPVGAHRCRFDGMQATVQVLAIPPMFSLEARTSVHAMDDWSTITARTLQTGANKVDLGIDNQDYEGAELRITWSYTATPSSALDDIALAGSSAPRIGSVHLPFRAPITILAVEDAQ